MPTEGKSHIAVLPFLATAPRVDLAPCLSLMPCTVWDAHLPSGWMGLCPPALAGLLASFPPCPSPPSPKR